MDTLFLLLYVIVINYLFIAKKKDFGLKVSKHMPMPESAIIMTNRPNN